MTNALNYQCGVNFHTHTYPLSHTPCTLVGDIQWPLKMRPFRPLSAIQLVRFRRPSKPSNKRYQLLKQRYRNARHTSDKSGDCNGDHTCKLPIWCCLEDLVVRQSTFVFSWSGARIVFDPADSENHTMATSNVTCSNIFGGAHHFISETSMQSLYTNLFLKQNS